MTLYLPKLGPHLKKPTQLSIFSHYKGTPLPHYRPNLTFESITPRFNHDRCHFTPAFVLPSDRVQLSLILQKFYQENASFERLKFDDRIQNAREKNITEVLLFTCRITINLFPPATTANFVGPTLKITSSTPKPHNTPIKLQPPLQTSILKNWRLLSCIRPFPSEKL